MTRGRHLVHRYNLAEFHRLFVRRQMLLERLGIVQLPDTTCRRGPGETHLIDRQILRDKIISQAFPQHFILVQIPPCLFQIQRQPPFADSQLFPLLLTKRSSTIWGARDTQRLPRIQPMDSGRQDRSEVQIWTRCPIDTPNLESMISRTAAQPDCSLAIFRSPGDVRSTTPRTVRHSRIRCNSWERESADGLKVIQHRLQEDGLDWRECWCVRRLFTLERLGVDRDVSVSSTSTCHPWLVNIRETNRIREDDGQLYPNTLGAKVALSLCLFAML